MSYNFFGFSVSQSISWISLIFSKHRDNFLLFKNLIKNLHDFLTKNKKKPPSDSAKMRVEFKMS